MHHFAFIVSSPSFTRCFFNKKVNPSQKVARRPKSNHTYNTRANKKERMYQFEQEIHELHEEVTTLWGELEKLSTLVASLAVAQNSL